MAELFDILGTVSTVELAGAAGTRPVRQITARAKPSGAVFSFIVVPADYQASHVNLIAHDIAARLNLDSDVPGVTDLNVYLDVNSAGQFVYKADVTIESTSGNSSATFTIAYATLWTDGFAQYVEKARANMDEIEGL